MAGRGTRNQTGAITEINVTPLVDITLVLLIIFMVTAKLIMSPQAMSLDLPKAASGKSVQDIFSIVLLANGRSEVNGSVIPNDAAIFHAASTKRAENRDFRAVIQADGSVPHRRVMQVLDFLKQAGVSKIGFGVVPAAPLAPDR